MIAWNTLNTVIHDLRHEDTYLNVFPLFHTGGMFVYTLPNVILGGTTILVRDFIPEQVLGLIESELVTGSWSVALSAIMVFLSCSPVNSLACMANCSRMLQVFCH